MEPGERLNFRTPDAHSDAYFHDIRLKPYRLGVFPGMDLPKGVLKARLPSRRSRKAANAEYNVKPEKLIAASRGFFQPEGGRPRISSSALRLEMWYCAGRDGSP